MPPWHKLAGMDLRHLRAFVAVATAGTVSKAALELRIAQPALSRQIVNLESELGVRLFDRIRRRLVLTSEGEQLLQDCRAILGGVNALSERAQQIGRGDSGILRVGATPQMMEGVFARFLHNFAQRWPNVKVTLTEGFGNQLRQMLERGDLHLCITLIQSLGSTLQELQSVELPPIEFLAACHKSLDLGPADSIDIRRLAPHPLLLHDKSIVQRQTFDGACRFAGFKPNVFFESRTPHTLLAFAAAGHGIAIIPSVLPTDRYRLRILRITHRGKPLREPFAMFWMKKRPLPPYAVAFCEALSSYMHEVCPITRPRSTRTSRPGR